MDWQQKIVERIGIEESTILIFDETDVLFSPEFNEYLNKKNIPFKLIKTEIELLSTVDIKNFRIIIVCRTLKLPTFLKEKFIIKRFTYNDLPILIEKKIQYKIPVKELIKMLVSNAEVGKPESITVLNYQDEYKKSQQLMIQLKSNKILMELEELISEEINIEKILKAGKLWGEYLKSSYKLGFGINYNLQNKLDEVVFNFIIKTGIKEVFYQRPEKLQSVHNILEYISDRKEEKIALVCFDGMGCAEWEILKEHLENAGLIFKEKHQFALIPTITSISRTAIFSGDYKTGYIKKNTKDDVLYNNYWKNKGFYSFFFRHGELINPEQLTGYNRIALLYNFVDDISHGMVLSRNDFSKNTFLNSIEEHCRNSEIEKEILLLKSKDYKIFICSDHGSVLSSGNGRRIDKYMIDTAGRRATVVENTILNDTILKDEKSYKIPLIEDKFAILAEKRTMYSGRNQKAITHGGITLEELVVPFIEVIN